MIIQYPELCRNVPKKIKLTIMLQQKSPFPSSDGEMNPKRIWKNRRSKHNLSTNFADRRYGKQVTTRLATSLLTRVFISVPGRGKVTWYIG
jgi:hypothetical protein